MKPVLHWEAVAVALGGADALAVGVAAAMEAAAEAGWAGEEAVAAVVAGAAAVRAAEAEGGALTVLVAEPVAVLLLEFVCARVEAERRRRETHSSSMAGAGGMRSPRVPLALPVAVGSQGFLSEAGRPPAAY